MSTQDLSVAFGSLPEEILVNIFKWAGKTPSHRLVSRTTLRIMETVYNRLYNSYKKLNNPYLNEVIEKVEQQDPNAAFFHKVSSVYVTIFNHINCLSQKEKYKKELEILEKHRHTLSAQRLTDLESLYRKEIDKVTGPLITWDKGGFGFIELEEND